MDLPLFGFYSRQLKSMRTHPRVANDVCRPTEGANMNPKKEASERQAEAPARRVAADAPNGVSSQKWQATEKLADEILVRLERLLREDPAAIVDKQTGMLPREVQEKQAYFLEKIVHAENTLRELARVVPRTDQAADPRQLVSTELMLFFVLVEAFRPERFTEAGFKLDERTRSTISEKIDSLVLDIFNMRERLK
jgi:hypothetical protein